MFRENLKDLIEFKCLTIRELSERTGINKRTLETYVDKRSVIPNAEIAVKLAQALDTTVEYLVTGNEKINETTRFEKADLDNFKKYEHIFYDLEQIDSDLLLSISAMIHTAANVSKIRLPQVALV